MLVYIKLDGDFVGHFFQKIETWLKLYGNVQWGRVVH